METLRRYWGYHEFRPKQESIIRSLLAGRDTCVVMPTGGGKSLCYQLPAVISGKTTIVVSPLIALMQDQAAQLAQMGIPAAAVNSFQTSSEHSKVMVNAKRIIEIKRLFYGGCEITLQNGARLTLSRRNRDKLKQLGLG